MFTRPLPRPRLLCAAGCLCVAGCSAAGDGGPTSPGGKAATNSVAIKFCAPELPVWVAYQNGIDGPWTAVTAGAPGTYAFSVGDKGAIAYVTPRNGDAASYGYATTVIHASATELQTISLPSCRTDDRGTKSVSGVATGLDAGDFSMIALGSAFNIAFPDGPEGAAPFVLSGAPAGSHALIASRVSASAMGTIASKVIIRRGLNPAAGAALPALNFKSSEAVSTTIGKLTVTGLGAETGYFNSEFIDAGGTSLTLSDAPSVSPSTSLVMAGIPAASLATGDLHASYVSTESRGVNSYTRLVSDRTVALGPAIGTPVITTVASSPSVRIRMQIPAQASYTSAMVAEFNQGNGPASRQVELAVTAAYVGGAPATWSAAVPDLSGAAGYSASFGMTAATSVQSVAILTGGNMLFFALPTDGATLSYALADASRLSSARVGRDGSPAPASSARVWSATTHTVLRAWRRN